MREITARLRSLRAMIRGLFALDWLGRSLLFASIFLAGTFAFDYSLHAFLDSPPPNWLLHLAAGFGCLYLAYLFARRLVWPLSIPISDDDLALLVERTHPVFRDRLVSALQLSRTRGAAPDFNSPELIDALVQETSKDHDAIRFDQVLTGRHVLPKLLQAVGLAALLGLLAYHFPGEAETFLARLFGERRWPSEVELEVLGFEGKTKVVARGDNFPVRVVAKKKRPWRVFLAYEVLGQGESDQVKMDPDVNAPAEPGRYGFIHEFRNLQYPIRFRAVTRDIESETYELEILDSPTITGYRIRYRFPPYLHLTDTPAEFPLTDPNITVPLGTEVRLQADATDDLRQAELLVGPRNALRRVPLQILADASGRPRKVAGTFTVDWEAAEYAIHAVSSRGLPTKDPPRHPIRGIRDQPPKFDVTRPRNRTEEVTVQCLKELLFRVEDDYGIREIRVQARVLTETSKPDWPGKDRLLTDIEFASGRYGDKMIHVKDRLVLGSLGVKERDVVELRFVAQDFKDVGELNLTRIDPPYQFRIISVLELEAKLETEIERLKGELRRLQSLQGTRLARTAALLESLQGKESLSMDERGDLRSHSIDQSNITARLEAIRKDLNYVMERGLENSIFDSKSAAALELAVTLLDDLIRPGGGGSYDAAQRLLSSSKSRDRKYRNQLLEEARTLQIACQERMARAIEALEKWATFQEAVRMAREAKAVTDQAHEEILKRLNCPNCKLKKACKEHGTQ